jgi:hypothetical protein
MPDFLPIMMQVDVVVFENNDPRQAVMGLVTRAAKRESD